MLPDGIESRTVAIPVRTERRLDEVADLHSTWWQMLPHRVNRGQRRKRMGTSQGSYWHRRASLQTRRAPACRSWRGHAVAIECIRDSWRSVQSYFACRLRIARGRIGLRSIRPPSLPSEVGIADPDRPEAERGALPVDGGPEPGAHTAGRSTWGAPRHAASPRETRRSFGSPHQYRETLKSDQPAELRRESRCGRGPPLSELEQCEIVCQLDGAAEGGPGLGQHRLREGFSRYVG
jgi:hypothetical protein